MSSRHCTVRHFSWKENLINVREGCSIQKEYRTCTKHLEFFKAYFEVAGIILRENVHMGVIYIQGEQLWGEKAASGDDLFTGAEAYL